MNSKKVAQAFNDFRVFPRLFGLLFILITWRVVNWYSGIEVPNIEQSGFASSVIATSAAYFNFYVKSGRAIVDPEEKKYLDESKHRRK